MSEWKTCKVAAEESLTGSNWIRPVQIIGPPEGETSPCPRLRLVTLVYPRVVEFRQPQVVVGRHNDADLQLLQSDISRKHCRFLWEGGQWYVEDLDSLNGTTLNGDRIRKSPLNVKDVVGIASHLFQVDLGGSSAALPAPTENEYAQNILRSIGTVLPEEPAIIPIIPIKRRRSA